MIFFLRHSVPGREVLKEQLLAGGWEKFGGHYYG